MTSAPEPRRESKVVHGHKRSYLLAGPPLGSAPVVLLVHGIGDSAESWGSVLPELGRTHTVLAPDLLGHGESDKPTADYSIGGFANGMRDLLVLLGVERATVIGHSLGGGVALQLAYQYPERVERLVLVASGGLGSEVSPLLRLATLPFSSAAIGLLTSPPVRLPTLAIGGLAARLGLLDPADVDDGGHVLRRLADRRTRSAFLRTLRHVVDARGQAFTSLDRLYLTEAVPTMVVWGDRDPVLPSSQARALAIDLAHARVEVMTRAGHLPHRSDPTQFLALVRSFLDETAPAVHSPSAWRELLDRDPG